MNEFELELHALSSTKLPISASKIQSVTRTAFKAVKHYKEVVHVMEKYLQSCPTQYKLPAIYVIDSICRVCCKSSGGGSSGDKYRELLHQRIELRLRGLFGMAALCTGKDRERLKRLLDVWAKNQIFSEEALAPLPALLETLAPVEEHESTAEIQASTSTTSAHTKSGGEDTPNSKKGSKGSRSGGTRPEETPQKQVQPVEPPRVEVDNPHAHAMMQSLFSMMAPGSAPGHAAATAVSGEAQKASKAAATISNLLMGDGSKEDDGSSIAIFDYDEGSAAGSSSELEDGDDEEGVERGTAANSSNKKKNIMSKVADAENASITPEEQMRSLLTAVQSVIPHQAPPLSVSTSVAPASMIPVLPISTPTSATAVLTPGAPPAAVNPLLGMNPALIMPMMAGMFPGMMMPGRPPAPMAVPPPPGRLPMNMPTMGMPIMPQMQNLGFEEYNEFGRIRRLEPGMSQDSIRILSRTLYMGGLTDGIGAPQLAAVFQHYDPESILVNAEAHSAFVKFKARSIAEHAKAHHNGEMVAGTPLKLNWACGFGPKDIFDRTRGFSTIADRDLKDGERRWLIQEIGSDYLQRHSQIVLNKGNVGERDLWFGGVLCEEPDTSKKGSQEKRHRDDDEDERESRRRHD